MIAYWLVIFWRFVVRLVVPVRARDVACVNPDAPCPVCGARRGKLRAVRQFTSTATSGMSVMVQHECSVCGARFYEAPVVKLTVSSVRGAVGFDCADYAAVERPANFQRRLMR